MKAHLDWAVRTGSLTSKLFGIGIAAVGIARLWSHPARQKHSFTARAAYSSAYLLHVGATTLAAASYLGASPISPQFATALMGITSLLTNYVSVLDTEASHTLIEQECHLLEGKVNNHQRLLEQKILLLETAKDYQTQIDILMKELSDLQIIQRDIVQARKSSTAHRIEKLIEIHTRLSENFEAKIKRDNIVKQFFQEKKSILIEDVLNEIADHTFATAAKINRLKEQRSTKPDKLKRKLASLDDEMEKWGILRVQCIRYKKIELMITQLTTQLSRLDTLKTVHANRIKPILESRIQALQESLAQIRMPKTQPFTIDLPLMITLAQHISQDVKAFDAELSQSLEQQIKSLQSQIEVKKQHAEQIQLYLNLLFPNPTEALQRQFSTLRDDNQALVTARRNLHVEAFKKQAMITNVNFCSITTLLAVSLCLVPEQNTNYLIKVLMIGFGFLGSTSSFVNFCKRYLFEMKQDESKERKIKTFELELEFNKASSLQIAPTLVSNRSRNAKTKALTLMYEQSRGRKREGSMSVGKRRKLVNH